VRFGDPELQRCYESNLAEIGPSPGQFREIGVLLTVHETFVMLEGAHSARVHETIDHLLLPELRPGLRRWYHQSSATLDSAGLATRDHLSQLAGERLEAVEDIPHNPD